MNVGHPLTASRAAGLHRILHRMWTAYSPAALRVQACRKVAEPKIQAHLRALRSVGYANARLTLEGRIEAELGFAQRAEYAGNYGAAGGAHDP
jgi:hypothetical protein